MSKINAPRYAAVVKAINEMVRGDGAAVQAIVTAREDAKFDATLCASEVEAELFARVHDGDITSGSANVMLSRVRKLTTCKMVHLIEACTESMGLTAVYTAVLKAERAAAGKAPKKSGTKTAKPTEDTAANEATYTAPVKFADYMLALRGMDAHANEVGLSATDAVMLKETIAEAMAILKRYTK